MNAEERKYKIFKTFYHNASGDEIIRHLEEKLSDHRIINYDNYLIMKDGILANYCTSKIRKTREENPDIMEAYNDLLKKMSILAKELNFENSLELNILFSYLLWNGYLSVHKQYKFSSADKRNIDGLFFADIMDGKGVCLNNTEMLKDFLCYNGYPSAILQNFYNKSSKTDYKIQIAKQRDNKKNRENIIKNILKKNANHVYNLIEDNNKLYIYDSTNLSMHKIINPYKSSLINGTGDFKLFPYRSYMLCYDTKEIALLDRLMTTNDYESPYTREDLISVCSIDIDLLIQSTQLVEDFFVEAKRNIIDISEKTAKIKARSK